MKKNFKMSAFSLMEMMIVLLIVALIAAASAPLISKKMMRQTGTGDSPWVFTGTGNNIAFNMNHNPNDTVFIGRQGLTFGFDNGNDYLDERVTRVTGVPLLVHSDSAGQQGQNIYPAIAFANSGNQIMGYLGMSRGTTYFSNVIPTDQNDGQAGATIIGTEIDARLNGQRNTVTNKIIVGYDINYRSIDPSGTNANHDILYGSHIGDANPIQSINDVANGVGDDIIQKANIIIGDNINAASPISRTVVIGNGQRNWNDANRGNRTIASGGRVDNGVAIGSLATVTRGRSPIAVGFMSTANGNSAVAIGNNSIAQNNNSIAIGDNTLANTNSVAIGNHARTTRDNAVIIGNHVVQGNDIGGANSNSTIAIGNGAQAGVNPRTGAGAIAIGSLLDENNPANTNTRALANHSIAIGTNAHVDQNANNSVAIGRNAIANRNNRIVLGSDNADGLRNSHTVVIPGTLSVTSIDNTTLDAIRNALQIDSDIRLKNVGEKFTSGLEDIKKLNFFNYTYKNDKEKKPHVGVMAQNLQKVFPISVSEGSDGYLRIRLDEMFYAALNAIKELDNKIIEIKNKVVAYFDRVEKLEAQIDAQQKTIEELRAQNAEFKKRLAKIEKGVNKRAGAKNNIKHIESEAK